MLLGGEMQGTGLGQHAARVSWVVVGLDGGGGQGADVVLWQERG